MVNAKSITVIVVALLMVTVLFAMLPDLVVQAATSVHNLSDTLSTNGAVIGTAPATFAGNIDTYAGWFWVIGPLILIIALIVGLFFRRGRRY